MKRYWILGLAIFLLILVNVSFYYLRQSRETPSQFTDSGTITEVNFSNKYFVYVSESRYPLKIHNKVDHFRIYFDDDTDIFIRSFFSVDNIVLGATPVVSAQESDLTKDARIRLAQTISEEDRYYAKKIFVENPIEKLTEVYPSVQ